MPKPLAIIFTPGLMADKLHSFPREKMQKEHKTPFPSHAHLLQVSSQLIYFQFAISQLLMTGSNKQHCSCRFFFLKDPVQFPPIFCK